MCEEIEGYDDSKEILITAIDSLQKDFDYIDRLIDMHGYDPKLLKQLLSTISNHFDFSSFNEFQ